MYRGFSVALMIAASSASGTWHPQQTVVADNLPRETRIDLPAGDAVNLELAHVAGRVGVQRADRPLTRQELISIMLLMSAERQNPRARS
ncbi:MAG TPA: hypothetical protein VG867_11250 [Rhizomicrobium sp.]|nr:hypothetical protein [Rhizomicrobium sp.]